MALSVSGLTSAQVCYQVQVVSKPRFALVVTTWVYVGHDEARNEYWFTHWHDFLRHEGFGEPLRKVGFRPEGDPLEFPTLLPAEELLSTVSTMLDELAEEDA